jgi:hypothetical protein
VGGLAACGDDEDSEASSSSESTALSEDELVSEAQAICTEHNEAITAGFTEEGIKGQPTPVEVRALVKDYVLPQYSAWIGRQDALEPPEDLAGDWDTWIADSTAARDAIKDDPNVAFDPSQFETVNGEADDLGLGEQCYAGPT